MAVSLLSVKGCKISPVLGRLAVRLGSVDSRPQVPNLNQINMQNLSNVAGFSAVVLFGSAVAVPGLSVLFALCGVVAGAVWVLDQCSEPTTK